MATQSTIEWTEQTWNPTTGCTKVSPGCKNCYAEVMARRLHAMGAPGYEPTGADGSCESGCTIFDPNSGERIPRREFFNTLLVAPDGRTKVWARH